MVSLVTYSILHATIRLFFLSNNPPTTEIYTLSLHDALPIFGALAENGAVTVPLEATFFAVRFGMVTDQYGIPWMINCELPAEDRKSTRLNSSHANISYAVFCLKKKKKESKCTRPVISYNY